MNHNEAVPVAIVARVSTNKQDYHRQIDELQGFAKTKGYVVTKIIQSIISGNKSARPDLDELFEAAKAGLFKKVLVLEVSRLGRRAKDIRDTLEKLHSYDISVVFKNLGVESYGDGKERFDTNTIINIYAELAQEERRILIERINSGLDHAKRIGKPLGRREGSIESNALLLRKYSKLVRDIKEGLSLRKCCKIHDLSKNTVIKIKRLVL